MFETEDNLADNFQDGEPEEALDMSGDFNGNISTEQHHDIRSLREDLPSILPEERPLELQARRIAESTVHVYVYLGPKNMLETALKRNQATVFLLGWFSYASTYLQRKPLGVIKGDLAHDLSLTTIQLGWLDTALLLPYAVVQILLSSLGDKVGPRKIFGVSLIISGFALVSFGAWNSYTILFILLFLSGSAQAQAWPNCSKTLRSWYPDNVCNSVFGIFGTCVFAGGIAGTSLAVYLQSTYSWRAVYLTPSFIVVILGVFVLLLFKSPKERGVEVPGKNVDIVVEDRKTTQLSWSEMLRLPVMKEVSISLLCVKMVRYSFYMWLPLYLFEHLKYSKAQSGMVSVTFEIGGVIGSAFLGVVIDRFFNGAFNCGPDIILSGSVPAEIGDMDGRNAAAAVVGIVNGIGSIGTFLEGPVIGFISQVYGWVGMFILMISLSVVGMVFSFLGAAVYAKTRL
ncbi:hypothetical protein ScPMuIL_007677 [Solemya velum]